MGVPGSANFLLAGAQGYQIERSLRFNSADSAYLNRTPASAGNRKTFTISFWIKKAKTGGGTLDDAVFTGNVQNGFLCNFRSDSLSLYDFYAASGGFQIWSARVFRDPSAWYHILIAIDTTQATDSNRAKVYINGIQENLATWTLAAGASRYPSLDATFDWNNTNSHKIGYADAHNYLNGYLTEFHNIDGQALTPSSFGETDTITGVWKPKRYSGTYGTNGFYLKFADNSGTTSTTLGKDSSGNGNNWTPNNFSVTAGSGNDSMIDTPTPYADGGNGRGNYCTLNPLDNGGNTVSNGNLVVNTATGFDLIRSTMFLSSGKWYWEITCDDCGEGFVGISSAAESLTARGAETANSAVVRTTNGDLRTSAVNSGYGSAIADGDVMIFALDMDSGKFWAGKNGTWFNSGNPASGTNAGKTGLTVAVSPSISVYDNEDYTANFGQRAFAYTPPSGFLALNTQNLPEPTIKKPSNYFDAVLWTGNGTSGRVITSNVETVDLAWVKIRSSADDHRLANTVTGGNKHLKSNATDAESTGTNIIQSFSGNTFTIGSDSSVNGNTSTYVGWTWKESATPGFDIVTYTGTGSATTVAHSLGVAPSMIIAKGRTNVDNWPVGHASRGWDRHILLNSTAAEAVTSSSWNNTAPTSSVFTVGTDARINQNGITYVAYLWSEVAGFSKFGSYTGNGSSDGPFVFCNFRPRFVMVKRTDSTGGWWIRDAARSSYNVTAEYLGAHSSSAEASSTFADFTSNGFKLRTTDAGENASGGTYVFAAFAEFPAKYSLAR